jgi:hypothetical protein
MFKFFTTPQHGAALAECIIGTTIVFVVVMALLHITSSGFKKRLTMALAFLGGAFYLVEFMLPARFHVLGFAGPVIDNPLSPYLEPSGNLQNIILSLAIMLGIVNLFRVNGRLIVRRRPGWHNGLVFFLGFFGMLTFGMLDYYKPLSAGAQAQVAGWYGVFFGGAFTALGATSFSLLAFYIVSAAYRSFRVRSPEAILLLISALIMMLGLTPLGTKFVTGWIPLDSSYAWLKLENVSEWILTVLNGAAQRALLFGIAVGVVATSLRIWLSLERGQFFDTEV